MEAFLGVVVIALLVEGSWVYAFWSVKNRLPRTVNEWIPGSLP